MPTPPEPDTAPDATPDAGPVSRWWGVAALALGVFGMVTVEELPIGVLKFLAADLDVSPGLAGLTITAPGYLAAVASLAVPVLIKDRDRRLVIVAAMVTMVAATIVGALATSYIVLLVSRLVVGVTIGTFWTIAPTLAVRMVKPADVPRATAIVFSGGSVAVVLGVPLATFLGTEWSWRAAFIAIAAVGVANAVMIRGWVPRLRSVGVGLRPSDMGRVARTPLVAVGVFATLTLVTAHFGLYTYATLILRDQAGVRADWVFGYLLAMGVAGLVGNFGISWVLHRSAVAAVVLMVAVLVTTHLLVATVTTNPTAAAACCVMWGFGGGSLSAGLQGWINQCGPDALEAATGANSAAFNIAIASGAGLGGAIVDTVGLPWLPLVTATIAVAPLGPLWWYVMRQRRRRVATQ